MQKFLSVLISALGVAAFAVFCFSIYGQYLLFATDQGFNDPARFSLLPGIAVGAGVLIAALAFVREHRKTSAERARHASEVFLARATDGFRTVIELLADQNNDRMLWIRASRTLLQALRLKEEITSKEYQLAYKLEEERARNDLYIALTSRDEKTGARRPLPPQFFYGIEDWSTTKTLDDAALKAAPDVKAYSVTIDSIPPQQSLRPLAVQSVVAIYEFLKYPEDYDDPLDDVKEWDEDWDRSHDIDQGARRYVAHTKQKFAIGGKLHEKPKVQEPEPGGS